MGFASILNPFIFLVCAPVCSLLPSSCCPVCLQEVGWCRDVCFGFESSGLVVFNIRLDLLMFAESFAWLAARCGLIKSATMFLKCFRSQLVNSSLLTFRLISI